MSGSYQPGRLLPMSWLEIAGATLTASSEAGGDYVVGNLLDPDPDLVLRTANANPLVLTATLDKKRPIDAAPFCAHNLSIGSTILMEAANDAAFTDIFYSLSIKGVGPAYSYGSWPGYGMFGYGGYDTGEGRWVWGYTPIWPDVIAKYVRWTIADPNNTAGYIQLGRLKVGKYWSAGPDTNFSWGKYAFGWRRDTRINRSRGGAALIPTRRRAYRAGHVGWEWLSEIDLSMLLDIQRQVGGVSDVFWSGYPGAGGRLEREHSALCVIVDWDLPTRPNAAQRVASIELAEVYDHG